MVSKAAYLSAVKAYLQSILSDEPPYFPLSFQPRSVYARDLFAAIPSLSLDEVVRSHHASSIIGPPGSGKTRALRDLAWTYCLDAQRGLQTKRTADVAMPVYVPLRHFRMSLEENPRTWQELILPPVNNVLGQHGCEFASPHEFVTFFRGHYFILFLDGLNELAGGEAGIFLDLVNSISLDCRIVIASRIREYPSERVDYPVYQVRPLEFPKQVKSFIRAVGNHYGLSLSEGSKVYKACERRPILRQLATNPCLLCQLCFAVSVHSGSLPEGKAALLRFIGRCMIQSQSSISVEDAERALCGLAFHMHESRILSITVSEAISCLRQLDGRQLHPKELIRKMTEARLLLRRRPDSENFNETDRDSLEFSHQIFQEFFAGMYVLENRLKPRCALPQAQRKLKGIVRSYARSLWDWEVLSIAVAGLADWDFDSALRATRSICHDNCCLATLILSELPDPQSNEDGENLALLRHSVLKKLEWRFKIWAFALPHVYKWLPLVALLAVFLGCYYCLLTFVQILTSRLLGEILAIRPWRIGLQVLFASLLGLCISAAYFRLLRLVYSYLDEVIFDRVVRRLIASLEVLSHHGGEEGLIALRLRAERNPYMGDRMRIWLSSAAAIPMGRIPYVFANLPPGLRLALIHKLADSPRENRVPQLLRLLSDLKTTERERDAVVEVLRKMLRMLGRDDLLFMHIIDSLHQHLQVEPSEKLKKKIRQVIEQPGKEQLLQYIREFLHKMRLIKWQLVGLLVLVALAVIVSTTRVPAFIDTIVKIIILVGALDQFFRIIYKIWRKLH